MTVAICSSTFMTYTASRCESTDPAAEPRLRLAARRIVGARCDSAPDRLHRYLAPASVSLRRGSPTTGRALGSSGGNRGVHGPAPQVSGGTASSIHRFNGPNSQPHRQPGDRGVVAARGSWLNAGGPPNSSRRSLSELTRSRFVTACPWRSSPSTHRNQRQLSRHRLRQQASAAPPPGEVRFFRGLITPLLSKLLVTPFDQEMRRKGYQLTRYADDWVATCESAAEARAAVAAALRILNELGVQLHPQKTRIVHVQQGFEFLGYNIKRGKQLRLPPVKISSGAQSVALYAIPREKSVRRFMD